MAISTAKMQQLLEQARTRLAAAQEHKAALSAQKLAATITISNPSEINLSNIGITNDTLSTDVGNDTAVEIISEIARSQTSTAPIPAMAAHSKPTSSYLQLNTKQQEAVNLGLSGKDMVLIGAAGTGKTTTVGQFTTRLIDENKLQQIGTITKVFNVTDLGCAIVSFTRKAVNNIRKSVHSDLKRNVTTMHALLEFEPQFFDIEDPENKGHIKKTMQFIPKRNALNPLPATIDLIIYEESSMIGFDLYKLFISALPHLPQEIFLGDIQQLPPIFGPAILGFKMDILPIVELTQVYRQALQSPIIRLAHTILSGDNTKFSARETTTKEVNPATGNLVTRKKIPALEAFEENSENGVLKFQVFQKKLPAELACNTIIKQFTVWAENGYYNPEEDIILCPFNKAFGTLEINKGISQYLGTKRNAEVHHIIAGFQEHYLAVGDRILYDKEDAVIISITRNSSYMGKSPKHKSIHLDRWGTYQEQLSAEEIVEGNLEDAEIQNAALDKMFSEMDYSGEGEEKDRENSASHIIKIRYSHSELETELSTSGEVNGILGGYCITVHKFQGSECDSVFLLLHDSHSIMCQRELLYTAVTRAKRRLHIICEPDTFFKGVKSQKVKGNNIKEKIAYFRGKVDYKEMQADVAFMQKMRAEKMARELV